jgi:uncharacterized protein YdhG (YjbR/CyaY superfamily)
VNSDFDAYFAKLPEAQRAALVRLRRFVHAALPRVEECISYDLPGFKLDGKGVLCLGGAKKHCAIYGLPGGTIRFQPDAPPTAAAFKKLLKARVSRLQKPK